MVEYYNGRFVDLSEYRRKTPKPEGLYEIKAENLKQKRATRHYYEQLEAWGMEECRFSSGVIDALSETEPIIFCGLLGKRITPDECLHCPHYKPKLPKPSKNDLKLTMFYSEG